MFLKELSRKEKKAFLHLCIHAAKANDVIEMKEREMISDYCKEMDYDEFDVEDIWPLDKVLELYNHESNKEVKRIVLLEILGLLYADGDFDVKEKEFFESVGEKLHVDKHTIDRIEELIGRYLQLCQELRMIITEEE